MTRTTQIPRLRTQRLISKGFVAPPSPAPPVTVVAGGPAIDPHGVVVLLHTYVARHEASEHLELVGHVVERLARVRRAHPHLPLVLCVGMQWRPGQRQEAHARLDALREVVEDSWPDLPYVGLSLPGAEKVLTTNAAIRLLGRSRPRGWLWLDDDIRLEPDCLAALVDRFVGHDRPVAVGATKVVQATPFRAARLLGWLSGATRPLRNYPNACCMLVSAEVVAEGIPTRLGADDAFVLFELLDPVADDPFRDLELVAGAKCQVWRGGRTKDTAHRLRANMFSHIMHMADYSWPRTRVYFTMTLFYGLWPFTPLDTRRGRGGAVARWLVKAVYFLWFVVEASALLARGLLGRPLRRAPWKPAVSPTDIRHERR